MKENEEKDVVNDQPEETKTGDLSVGMHDLSVIIMTGKLQKEVMHFVHDISKQTESSAIGIIISAIERKLSGKPMELSEGFDVNDRIQIETDAGDIVNKFVKAKMLAHFVELKHSVELSGLKPDMTIYEECIKDMPEGNDPIAYIKYRITRESIIFISEYKNIQEVGKTLIETLDAAYMVTGALLERLIEK